MKFYSIIGFLVVIVFFSCGQKTSSKQVIDKTEQKPLTFKSGLSIANGINRGTGYQDSLGTFHNVRYIPVRINNDSNVSVKLDLNFLKEYNHPFMEGNKFNIVPMKREWVVDGGEISDHMFLELQKDIKNPQITKTLEPGEELLFGIGTRYQVVGEEYIAPLPKMLFVHGERDGIRICENPVIADPTESNLELRVKLIFNQGNENEHCGIISCGKISYSE